jgi:uncharacterized protein with GYD domain
MATYVLLLNYTDQGIRSVQDSPRRLDAARELARQYRAEIRETYLTMGVYDLVALLDAPDDEAAAKFALAVGRLGNVRTTTLRAFPEQQYRNLIAALG